MRPSFFVIVSILVAATFLVGCGARKPAAASDVTEGRAELEIVNPPLDALCLQVTVAGTRTVTRNLTLVPGQSAVFMLNGLPLNSDAFSDVAFDTPCDSLAAGQAPTWVSDAVVAVVAAGTIAHVALTLHRDGRAVVTSTFEDDPDAAVSADGGGPAPDASAPASDAGGPDTPIVFGPPPTGRLDYFGGPIIEHVKVVAVYWPLVDTMTTSWVPAFFQTITNSPYLDWLSEYDTFVTTRSGQKGTGQAIGRGSYFGAVALSAASRATIDDSEIQTALAAQIAAGVLPPSDADTLYVVYFSRGVTIDFQGALSCQSFCGYHNAGTVAGTHLRYAVIADLSANGCDTGCGAGTIAQNTQAVSSHVLIEAITDPDPGSAWINPTMGEIGFLCNGQNVAFMGFEVQKEWSNVAASCVVTR